MQSGHQIWTSGAKGLRLVAAACAFLCLGGAAAADPVQPAQPAESAQPESAAARPPQPAGRLVPDLTTGHPAVGALPVAFIRSPDHAGPGGAGRYLLAINSGYGIQFDSGSHAQQSIALIDLNARPVPAVIQNVYFPTPQSANIGAAFGLARGENESAPAPGKDPVFPLYVSGGFENRIWRFTFTPGADQPISPGSPGPKTKVAAPFIDLAPLATAPPDPRSNGGKAAIYPAGITFDAIGNRLLVADNLGDSMGIVQAPDTEKPLLTARDLKRAPDDNVYPYEVLHLPGKSADDPGKSYLSCWNTASVAVVQVPAHPTGGTVTAPPGAPTFIGVGTHPTAMIFNASRTRLFVVNSNADSVSVIDTAADREIERIDVRLSDLALVGVSPESLVLGADGATLYVANARANAVAVVRLCEPSSGLRVAADERKDAGKKADAGSSQESRSRVVGLIPTGSYPSALALVGDTLYVGNGKGTGAENSSNVATETGLFPNVPNAAFPPNGKGRGAGRGGAYSVAIVSGNISAIQLPSDRALAAMTEAVLRENGFGGDKRPLPFANRHGGSPIRHVIYVIRENRTYDQVFGDVTASGDGTRADGDPSLAIFGDGDGARRPGGPSQQITPNAHALAQRFGLLDRFFVNSEASADGHNWSTAAYSSDYVDKEFRANYSERGRTYDFEGFNRLPFIDPHKDARHPKKNWPPAFPPDATAETVAAYLRKFLPYTHGGRDVGEPDTLYLWDLAARAHRTYRNYGEFVATVSANDLAAIRADQPKDYPDVSPTIVAIPAKASLVGHHSATGRNFDLSTPDALTVDSYLAGAEARDAGARETSASRPDPAILSDNANPRFQGVSRLGEWLADFRRAEADRAAGKPDALPALSIVRFSNDHTSGLRPLKPSPQFYVAENDYALGRMVEAVSHSPYWRDTAVVVLEDDAQDGPDHVDCHRSVALVISAYNRPGALVHSFHSTAGLLRTIEALLGLPPMNAQDAAAAPVDVFRDEPDLTPYDAALPRLDPAGLWNPAVAEAPDAETAAAIRRSATMDLAHADAADPAALNAAIWLSVRGSGRPAPPPAHLPVYDLRRASFSGAAAGGKDDDD